MIPKSRVYLAVDESKKKYALKRLKEDTSSNMKAITNEIEVLKALNHPNIIRVSSLRQGTLVKPNKTEKLKVPYALMELAPNGEILHYLMATGPFPVPIARHYFKSLMDGLIYCHGKGVAHRDIKPDNLLLGEKFELKLADFGFAAAFREKGKGGKLYTTLGTEAYMAPEIRGGIGYSGQAVDIFAAGIMLFIMMTGRPPFNKATPDDKYYVPFCTGRINKFWEMHNPKKVENEVFSKSFVQLISEMLAYNPAKRFTAEKVTSHPWYKEKEATSQEVYEYMFKKKEVVEKAMQKSKMQAAMKKKTRAKGSGQGYRSQNEGPLAKFEEFLEFQKANLAHLDFSKPRELPALEVFHFSLFYSNLNEKQKHDGNDFREIFTVLEPEEAIQLILGHCMMKNGPENAGKAILSESLYKVESVLYKIQYDKSLTTDLTFGFDIKKVDEETNSLHFILGDGDSFGFYRLVGEIRELFDKVHEELE